MNVESTVVYCTHQQKTKRKKQGDKKNEHNTK